MSDAYRCEICDELPQWTILRRGDVIVSWACPQHLSDVCSRLQRGWEVTELVVTDHYKAVEWAQLGNTLNSIVEGKR